MDASNAHGHCASEKKLILRERYWSKHGEISRKLDMLRLEKFPPNAQKRCGHSPWPKWLSLSGFLNPISRSCIWKARVPNR